MTKNLLAAVVVVALSACSSDSGTSDGAGNGPATPPTGNNNQNGNNNGPVDTTGVPGVWFGNNDYGNGVMIVDSAQNVYALTDNGNNSFQTVFGTLGSPLNHFFHRNEPTVAAADSFTIAGDLPTVHNPDLYTEDTISYSLQVTNDGQQINNSSAVGTFSMTRTSTNDVQTISVADATGNWVANTAYCPANDVQDCNLVLRFNVAADGAVTGSTQNNADPVNELTGTVAPASGATQYLGVTFKWLNLDRAGVMYKNPADPTRMILNTYGPNGTVSQSFSALLTRS